MNNILGIKSAWLSSRLRVTEVESITNRIRDSIVIKAKATFSASKRGSKE